MRITQVAVLGALSLSCGGSAELSTPLSAATTPPKEPMISLAFDDGYQSTLLNGLPVLDKFGFKATFYIIWNRSGPSYMGRQAYLALEASGHEIGGHTLNHFQLDTASDARAQADIKLGRDSLISMGVKRVATFAYPFGARNARTPGFVKDAGFIAGRTIDDGENTASTDPYLLLSPSLTDASSLSYVKGLIDKAVRDSTWLILTFHRVDEDGNSISIKHSYLETIFQYVKDKNVPVLTVYDAFKRLHP